MIQGVFLFLVIVLLSFGLLQQIGLFKKNHYLFLSGLLLASILILRNVDYGVIDMLRYHFDFEEIKHYSSLWKALLFSGGKDPGYWGLVYLFAKLGFSFDFFVYFIALFDIVVYIYFIKKHSVNYMLSNFVLLGSGCYTFMFYGLRQSLALGTFLLCIDAWYNKRILKTFVFLVASILLHWSSICALPFLLLSRLKFDLWVVAGYLVLLLFFGLFSSQIGNYLALLFSENYAIQNAEERSLGGLAIMSFLFLSWYLFLFYRDINSNYKIRFFLHGLIILCLIQFCSTLRYSFTRLNFYYMLGIMTTIVPMSFDYNYLKRLVGRGGKFFLICGTMALLLLMIYLFDIYISGNHLGNYIFMWEEIE